MYSVEGLENGIQQCKRNIKTFREAIERERKTIEEYKQMIEVLRDKERIELEKAKRVEVVSDGCAD